MELRERFASTHGRPGKRQGQHEKTSIEQHMQTGVMRTSYILRVTVRYAWRRAKMLHCFACVNTTLEQQLQTHGVMGQEAAEKIANSSPCQ